MTGETDPVARYGYERTANGVRVVVTTSDGADGAVVVFIDTEFEPDASDGGPGLRVILNDSDVYVGKPYVPHQPSTTECIRRQREPANPRRIPQPGDS